MFGNALNLCLASKLWWKVVKIMSAEPRRVGFQLPLTCDTHARKTWIRGNDHPPSRLPCRELGLMEILPQIPATGLCARGDAGSDVEDSCHADIGAG